MAQQLSSDRPVTSNNANDNERKIYAIGGGIGSLAAAAFLIRDGGIPGRNITIYEAMPILGGSLDGGGNPTDYHCPTTGTRDRRMVVPNSAIQRRLILVFPSLIGSRLR